jgi:hypothetical protein
MDISSQADLKILLAVCRADVEGRQPGQDAVLPALPSSDAGWSGIVACALNHGLVGLLYRTVANSDCIPPTALLPIRSAAHAQSARSCYLVHELLEILTAFRDLDITAVALKGPALAVLAYGHISDREFCDLDVLVHPADLDRAGLVLGQRGYRIDPRKSMIEDLSREGEYHVSFVRDDGSAEVELHWKLNSDLERAPIEDTGVWSRTQLVLLWDQPVPSLGIEDTLLFLCVHAFKHRWCRLKWLIDIAYVLRSREQIDWDALVLRSRQTGCYRMLLVGLNLASSLLGSVTPPAIAKLARADRVAMRLVERIRSALLSDAPVDGVEEIIYHLEAHERFRDHFVLVCRLLPRICRLTAKDGLLPNRPVWTQFIAVFKRLLRLFRTFGLAWVKPVFRFR